VIISSLHGVGTWVDDPVYGDRVELALVDPKRNARRYYAMTVLEDPQLPLFAGEPPRPVLVTSRGRLEGRRIVHRKPFDTLAGAVARWLELLRLRQRHGYVITSYTVRGNVVTVVPGRYYDHAAGRVSFNEVRA
jgi:predicted DNA-binding WGR domain protein